MFEDAELGHKISKTEYIKQVPELRERLLSGQFNLSSGSPPIIIIVEGVDNSSEGEVINRLAEWLDPHGLDITAFGPKTDDELSRPKFWRYWRTLPPKGRIGILSGSWYTGTLIQHAFGKVDDAYFERHMRQVARFERMLAEDGAVIIKFWLHMSQKEQKKHFNKIENTSACRSIISKTDDKVFRHYNRFVVSAERAIRLTDTASAPWHIIGAANSHYRDITIGQQIAKQLEKVVINSATQTNHHTVSPPAEQQTKNLNQPTVLDKVDLSLTLNKKEYREQLNTLQKKLNLLSWEAFHHGISLVLLFEGWDASGKGGAIRRITQAIDIRITQVISVAAPTDEEQAHHYLWRFWRHIPRSGRVIIYDRSWYGRLLVERVEGFASENELLRAPAEINEFEEELCEQDRLIMKFWIHIDKEEQLKRFKERENIPYKQHKITDEDWRNRNRWDDYIQAVNEMVIRTSTNYAPWTLVPGNCKHYARIHILEAICHQLEKKLKYKKG